ncbi:hypothetical protein CPC16_011609 [Podila verticillata]|nr:hypothetical protein CPC16_011609 [Podila verticillata]
MAFHQASKKILSRSVHPIIRRRQSTFSFFSRNQVSSHPSQNPPQPVASANTASSLPTYPSSPHALRISPTYSSAAPLLAALQNKDQDTAWMVYSVLARAGLLHTLLPLHHSMVLKSIRPEKSYRFTRTQTATLTERFEQVWANMRQAHIQPDMNDHTARLEFFAATRQHYRFDQAWTELKEAASMGQAGSGSNIHGAPSLPNVSSSSSSLILQPTIYTYNLVLSSCVSRENIGLAMETMTLMRRAGIKPDNMSWDYVLQIHTAMKNWPAVESTFRSAFITSPPGSSGHVSNSGINNITHASHLAIPLGQRTRTLHGGAYASGHYNASRLPLAGQQGIEQHKLVPSLQNIHTLFSYFAYTQDLEELRTMFDGHVRLFGLVPTTRTYNEMIKFAFLARRDGDALELFKELVQIGQNLEKVQSLGESNVSGQPQMTNGASESLSPTSVPPSTAGSESARYWTTTSQPHQVGGPDFDTFKIMINNELIASRNRWGRAWKWIRIMQESYGLEPSDSMFRRTLISMRRRRGDEATMQALQQNWERVRQRRDGHPQAQEVVTIEEQHEDEGQPEQHMEGRM